jgi:hypothetical protein
MILNRNVKSSSGSYGSGIGTGFSDYGNSTVWNVTILNGNIRASSSLHGPGIESGLASGGNAALGLAFRGRFVRPSRFQDMVQAVRVSSMRVAIQ